MGFSRSNEHFFPHIIKFTLCLTPVGAAHMDGDEREELHAAPPPLPPPADANLQDAAPSPLLPFAARVATRQRGGLWPAIR